MTGIISEVLGNAFRITTDAGEAKLIEVTVCSKLYQAGVELGDRIILNALASENSIYISKAIIYQSEWSHQIKHQQYIHGWW